MFSKTIILYLGLCPSLLSARAGDSIPLAFPPDTTAVLRGVLCIDKLPGPDAWAERGLGSSTAAALSKPFAWDSTGLDTGKKSPSNKSVAARLEERPVYFVSVDGGEWKEFSQARGNCVPDLSIEERHSIRIVDARKRPVASFRFRFGPGATAMRVYYYSFYNSWIVDTVPKRRIEKIVGTAKALVSCAVCR